MKTPHHVVWLRQDLRSTDNTALMAACENPEAIVTALYVATPKQWSAHDVAGVRIDFERRHLTMLQETLKSLGIALVVLQCDDFAAIPSLLSHWLQQHGVSALFANKQYELNELTRDQQVSEALNKVGVTSSWFDDLCISHQVKSLKQMPVITPYSHLLNVTGWALLSSKVYVSLLHHCHVKSR